MSIRTILFDLDGTLIDTNELIISSFVYTFEQYGLRLSREEILEFIGPPLIDTFEKVDKERSRQMFDTYREHNLLAHDEFVKPYPYVAETLKQLKEGDCQLGIVTTKLQKGVNMGLKVTGLEGLFDVIITLDDVTHAKPHPEPVIKAMKLLDRKADETLMVGDNTHDIEAGQNAGVKTAAVAWTIKGREKLAALNPTYMLEDMRDLLKIADV